MFLQTQYVSLRMVWAITTKNAICQERGLL